MGLRGWLCEGCEATRLASEGAAASAAAQAAPKHDPRSELQADMHRVAQGRSLSNTARRQVRWVGDES